MRKALKRSIKEDELVSGFQRASGWYEAHRDEARVTVIVLALVAGGALGLSYLQSQRKSAAEEEMTAALETFHGTIESQVPAGADRPAGPVFATAREKYTKAAAAFDGIERKYASLPEAVRARYYGALCRLELGDHAESQKTLSEIASRKDGGLEPALARLALAEGYRRSGQIAKAAEAFREMAGDASLALPRDHALMSLGSLLEDARRPAEARAAYRRLVEEFPGSVYAAEARRRAEYLGAPAQG